VYSVVGVLMVCSVGVFTSPNETLCFWSWCGVFMICECVCVSVCVCVLTSRKGLVCSQGVGVFFEFVCSLNRCVL